VLEKMILSNVMSIFCERMVDDREVASAEEIFEYLGDLSV
jgi:hypothetical protein